MEKHGSAQHHIGKKYRIYFEVGETPSRTEIIPGLSVENFIDIEGTSLAVTFSHSGFVFDISGCLIVHMDYKILGNFPIYRIHSQVSQYFKISNFQGDGDFFPHVAEGIDFPISIIYSFLDSILFYTDSKKPHFPSELNKSSFFLCPLNPGFKTDINKLHFENPEEFAKVWSVAKELGHSARIAKALGSRPMDIDISVRGTEIASFI